MVGMAQTQRSRRDRILFAGLWAFILLLNVFSILHRHHSDFLTLLTMATALMMIAYEVYHA